MREREREQRGREIIVEQREGHVQCCSSNHESRIRMHSRLERRMFFNGQFLERQKNREINRGARGAELLTRTINVLGVPLWIRKRKREGGERGVGSQSNLTGQCGLVWPDTTYMSTSTYRRDVSHARGLSASPKDTRTGEEKETETLLQFYTWLTARSLIRRYA